MNSHDPFDIKPFVDSDAAVKADYYPLTEKDVAEVTPMNRAQRRQWLSGRKDKTLVPFNRYGDGRG